MALLLYKQSSSVKQISLYQTPSRLLNDTSKALLKSSFGKVGMIQVRLPLVGTRVNVSWSCRYLWTRQVGRGSKIGINNAVEAGGNDFELRVTATMHPPSKKT